MTKKKPLKEAQFWVGLGASAGGLEALRGLARNLPNNISVTYIVAQHMAPHHKSMLSEIIGRESDIPVLDVEDGLVPQPNTVYITPPNQNIIVEGNCLRLVDPSKEPGAPKPSVDTFFKSLAKEKKEFAIGIILSGTGSDGSKGIVAINSHGGITIAQDELTAKYSSMPMVAMQTGLIDLVMSPEEIGAQISKITALPRDLNALRASPLNLDGVSELIQLLFDQTKVNFRHYKTATFQRRVERRMAAHNTTSLEDYVTIAKASQAEVQSLFGDLLISVTSFFRDPIEFESLESYIDTIVENKGNDHIRVWVPGTATGEEAYTLAMLFSEAMAKNGSRDNAKLQIFATDIDQNAIEIARRGFYSHSALERVPDAFVDKYFDRAPAGYTVKKLLREKMVFSYHNIAQDPPFLHMDMISCRNLLIYFQASLQAEVFTRFHYSLVPAGLLFLGKSEAVSASEALFKQAGNDKHIFFQRPSHKRVAPRDMTYQVAPNTKPETQIQKTLATRDQNEAIQRLESLIKGMGKCSLLIDSNMNLIKGYGEMTPFVAISEGFIDTKVSSMIKQPYRQDLQALVPGVIRKNQMARGFTRSNPNNPKLREKMTVYPIDNGQLNDTMALAVFEEWLDETPDALKISIASLGDHELHNQLESLSNELAIAKTNLQQTVEELETSNEELQALNEELQSSNEELQSTNEELETSNEELQSTNEELSTVNEELQVNSGQLNAVNQNLSSILDNITIPLLVVDRQLCVTNASVVAEDFFGMKQGLSLPHISLCNRRSGFPDLTSAVSSALNSGTPKSWQVGQGEENAILKIVPHFSASNELIGAIVFVSDNTEEMRRVNAELQLIFNNVPAALIVRDKKGKIISANSKAKEMLSASNDSVVGTNFYDYFDDEVTAQIRADDEIVLESGEPSLEKTQFVRYTDGREIWARMSRIPAEHPNSDSGVIYAVTQNITETHNAARALQESELRLDQAVKASDVGLWDWDKVNDNVFWSPRLIDMLMLNEKDLKNDIRDFNTRIHPDDLERVKAAREDHFTNAAPYNLSYRLMRSDDSYIWVETHGQAIFDGNGKAIRFTGTLRDITDERRNIEALREQKEQLELAATLSGIGYWKVDIAEETLVWSQQVHVIHGTDSKTYQPRLDSAIEFYLPEERENVSKTIQETIQDGTGFIFEAQIKRADGELRMMRAIGTPDTNAEGKVVAIFGVFQDIDEHTKREESLQKILSELAKSNEELNRFSYVCSHDMKEPVRLIEAMANLLVNPKFSGDEEKRGELLKKISKNTERLRDIIDSLLAYSRIDAKVDFSSVDLNKILDGVLGSLSLAIEEANAKVEVGTLPSVNGAPVHFTQLFHNLISNALKFTDNKQPKIKIDAVMKAKGCQILIEDNGPGIPKDSREEVFKLFTRLQRQDEVEGTGLGLSIAQRIAMQNGGTIKCVDSSLGGAAFEIFVPKTPKEA